MSPVHRTATNRRAFLQMTVLGAVGTAVLAACAQPASPTETPAPKAAEPTKPAAAAPTATPATKPAASTQQVTIGYWYGVDSQDQAAIHTDAAAKFQQLHPDIKINPELVVWADSLNKQLAAFAAGSGVPDTTMVDSGRFAQFYDNKMFVNLDDRFKAWKYAADMLPTVAEFGRPRANTPVCAMVNLILADYIYYRADWLADAKLKVPETNDDFVAVAQALNKPPNHSGYALRAGDGGHQNHLWSIMRGNGVSVIKDDGTTDLDSADGVASVDWFVSLATKHKVTQPSALTDKYPEIYALFQSDKVGLMQHGLRSWKIQDDVLHEKASAFFFPKGKSTRWSSVGMNGASVFNTTKFVDQAWEWVAYTAEPEMAARMSKERGSPATLKSLQNDPIYTQNRFFKAAMDGAPYWGRLPDPTVPANWTKMNQRWVPEFQRLLRQEVTAQQFCTSMADILRGKA